jgi:hypothetical protein
VAPSRNSSPFYAWVRILSHLLFSSFLLLFFFWTLSTAIFLEAMRSREASSAHLLIVFDQPPPQKEADGLKATLEKIVGTGNVSPMVAAPGEGPSERRTRKRILSVLLVPGTKNDGHPVLLSEMVRSITQVVHNDARVQDVVYSPDWIERIDSLLALSIKIHRGLFLLLILFALSLSLYWGAAGPDLVALLGDLSRPDEGSGGARRTPLFSQEPAASSDDPSFLKVHRSNPLPRPFSGALFGGVSALIVLLLSWSLKGILFPEGSSPFAAFPGVLPLGGRPWLLFFVGAVGCGLLGGIFSAGLSGFSKNPGDRLS